MYLAALEVLDEPAAPAGEGEGEAGRALGAEGQTSEGALYGLLLCLQLAGDGARDPAAVRALLQRLTARGSTRRPAVWLEHAAQMGGGQEERRALGEAVAADAGLRETDAWVARCPAEGGACQALDKAAVALREQPGGVAVTVRTVAAALARDPGSFAGRYLRSLDRLRAGETLAGLRDLRWVQLLRPRDGHIKGAIAAVLRGALAAPILAARLLWDLGTLGALRFLPPAAAPAAAEHDLADAPGVRLPMHRASVEALFGDGGWLAPVCATPASPHDTAHLAAASWPLPAGVPASPAPRAGVALEWPGTPETPVTSEAPTSVATEATSEATPAAHRLAGHDPAPGAELSDVSNSVSGARRRLGFYLPTRSAEALGDEAGAGGGADLANADGERGCEGESSDGSDGEGTWSCDAQPAVDLPYSARTATPLRAGTGAADSSSPPATPQDLRDTPARAPPPAWGLSPSDAPTPRDRRPTPCRVQPAATPLTLTLTQPGPGGTPRLGAALSSHSPSESPAPRGATARSASSDESLSPGEMACLAELVSPLATRAALTPPSPVTWQVGGTPAGAAPGSEAKSPITIRCLQNGASDRFRRPRLSLAGLSPSPAVGALDAAAWPPGASVEEEGEATGEATPRHHADGVDSVACDTPDGEVGSEVPPSASAEGEPGSAEDASGAQGTAPWRGSGADSCASPRADENDPGGSPGLWASAGRSTAALPRLSPSVSPGPAQSSADAFSAEADTQGAEGGGTTMVDEESSAETPVDVDHVHGVAGASENADEAPETPPDTPGWKARGLEKREARQEAKARAVAQRMAADALEGLAALLASPQPLPQQHGLEAASSVEKELPATPMLTREVLVGTAGLRVGRTPLVASKRALPALSRAASRPLKHLRVATPVAPGSARLVAPLAPPVPPFAAPSPVHNSSTLAPAQAASCVLAAATGEIDSAEGQAPAAEPGVRRRGLRSSPNAAARAEAIAAAAQELLGGRRRKKRAGPPGPPYSEPEMAQTAGHVGAASSGEANGSGVGDIEGQPEMVDAGGEEQSGRLLKYARQKETQEALAPAPVAGEAFAEGGAALPIDGADLERQASTAQASREAGPIVAHAAQRSTDEEESEPAAQGVLQRPPNKTRTSPSTPSIPGAAATGVAATGVANAVGVTRPTVTEHRPWIRRVMAAPLRSLLALKTLARSPAAVATDSGAASWAPASPRGPDLSRSSALEPEGATEPDDTPSRSDVLTRQGRDQVGEVSEPRRGARTAAMGAGCTHVAGADVSDDSRAVPSRVAPEAGEASGAAHVGDLFAGFSRTSWGAAGGKGAWAEERERRAVPSSRETQVSGEVSESDSLFEARSPGSGQWAGTMTVTPGRPRHAGPATALSTPGPQSGAESAGAAEVFPWRPEHVASPHGDVASPLGAIRLEERPAEWPGAGADAALERQRPPGDSASPSPDRLDYRGLPRHELGAARSFEQLVASDSEELARARGRIVSGAVARCLHRNRLTLSQERPGWGPPPPNARVYSAARGVALRSALSRGDKHKVLGAAGRAEGVREGDVLLGEPAGDAAGAWVVVRDVRFAGLAEGGALYLPMATVGQEKGLQGEELLLDLGAADHHLHFLDLDPERSDTAPPLHPRRPTPPPPPTPAPGA